MHDEISSTDRLRMVDRGANFGDLTGDDLLFEELRYIRGIGRELAGRLLEDIKQSHWLEADRKAQRAAALREAARAWKSGAWADAPHHEIRAADRIGAGQYAGDWLEARADRIEASDA